MPASVTDVPQAVQHCHGARPAPELVRPPPQEGNPLLHLDRGIVTTPAIVDQLTDQDMVIAMLLPATLPPVGLQRLVEMKAMSAERTKAERLRKEAKQMDREMALLNKQ